MGPLEFILVALAGNAAILAVLGLLARSLLSQLLAKDIERFKASLSQASSVAAEEMKHRLSLAAHEHNVRFNRLHEKQAGVLEEIYEKLLKFEDASAVMALVSEETPQTSVELALRRAEDAGRDLDQYIRRHEIYLPTSTSEKLAVLLKRVFALLGNCSFNLMSRMLATDGTPEIFPEAREAWTQVHSYLENEAPLVRKSLETEFRRLLGTEVGVTA